jgi:TrmH family RNA methyltransferase
LTTITSLHNERVKLIRALQTQGKVRRKEGRIALEGARLIEDALLSGVRPEFAFYTPDADTDTPDQPAARLLLKLRERDIPCLEVTSEIMAHVSDTEVPQGIIAVVPLPALDVPANPALALILDGIADPGNMGTILRTSAAAGVDVVVLAPHCVDPFNPKVLRSGMGAHFRVPLVRKSWSEIAADYGNLALYLAEANSDLPYYRVDWARPSAVIIGGEARGVDPRARELSPTSIAIPMSKSVESLNAAMATAVILFEIRRQRAV